MDKKVVIYSTSTCHFCHMAKDFFKANNVPFEDIDVVADRAKAKEMIDKSGQMGVPVIFIGEEMTIGFDEDRIKSQLGL